MKVMVVLLRGFHVGYLGCYGNEWIDTPHLDRLAAEGVVFDQHFAHCPEGAAASREWRTGFIAPPTEPSADLLTLLHTRGVHSQLILNGGNAGGSEFTKEWSAVQRAPIHPDSSQPLATLVEMADQGLDDLAAHENYLLWIELDSLIPPWLIPSEDLEAYFESTPSAQDEESPEADSAAEALEPLVDPQPGPLPAPVEQSFQRLQLTYAAAVSHVDSCVGLLCENLRDRKLAEETLLIVTSDRGPPLGEHGTVGMYRPWLHDELIHLPFLMRLPGGVGAGRRIPGLTQSVDLYATLLDAFGIVSPPNPGYSLLPLARGETEEVRSHVCCGMRLGEREEWALRTREWAFILPVAAPADDPFRGPQLYVKPDDRWEVNNVLQHHLELGDRLEAVLRDHMAKPRRIGREMPWVANSGGIST
jgi:arylsulfatase A-like enzyme